MSGIFSKKNILKRLEKEYKKPLGEKIIKAFDFAYDAHKNQFRTTSNNSKIPYIVHPVGVAINVIKYYNLVKLDADLDDLILVSLLHDILEDTNKSFNELSQIVDLKIIQEIDVLTKPAVHKFKGSNQERNKVFIQKIIESGDSTIFVKICDSIHNLSKPQITPKKLIEKQIDKAKKNYLKMIENNSNFDKLKKVYLDLIEKTKFELESKNVVDKKVEFLSLEDAIKKISELIYGKILELHDIVDILEEVTLAQSVSIWRCRGKKLDKLNLFFQTKDEFVKQKEIEISNLNLEPLELKNNDFSKFVKVFEKKDSIKFIFANPLHVNSCEKFVIILSFKKKLDWISIETLNLFVQILSHKLLVTEADRRLNIANHASNLNLDINIEKAVEINLTLNDLENIFYWRNLCKKVIVSVSSILNNFLVFNLSNNIYSNLFKIESRVKSSNSIIDKIERLNIKDRKNFELIEDVAGVRVICPTYFDLKSLYDFLLEKVREDKDVCLHSRIENNIRNYIEKPLSNGYKAIHFILDVKIKDDNLNLVSVPCEIQLQTYFDNIWANISHLTSYKRNCSKKITSSYLKELAKNLESSEKILFELNNKLNQ